VIIKQNSKIRLFNRNFFISKKILYRAKVISIAEEKNRKEYHLGAVCALTKEELLKNKVLKQSRKNNPIKIF